MFYKCFMFEYKCMHLFSKTKYTPLNRNCVTKSDTLNDKKKFSLLNHIIRITPVTPAPI